MDFYRIQDKIVSWQKIEKSLRKILTLRTRGFSQQEVANRLKTDRTFISRLEGLGELRKGKTVACVGFPIKNKDELKELLEKEGVDFILLFTEAERLDFINKRNSREVLNELLNLTAQIKTHDIVICIGSDERLKLMEGVLDNPPITIELGTSPLTEDKWVDTQEIKKILRSIKNARY